MTLIELFGKDKFYRNIDGLSIKIKHAEISKGEFYEQDGQLFFIHDNGEEECLCHEVGAWMIYNDDSIIFTWDMNNKSDDFCIMNFEGAILSRGIISSDGRLVFVEDDIVYAQKPFSSEKEIIFGLDCVPDDYEFYENEIRFIKDDKVIGFSLD